MKDLCLALVALGCAGLAQAAPPAPFITAASSNIKELSFAWEPVPSASRYELWFRATPGSPWGKYTEASAPRSSISINVSVHLLDWRVARYHVKACDASGCSTSNEVGVDGEQLAAIGYIKPNAADTHTWFGRQVALSADGRTMAVSTGERMGARVNSAAIHIYRKTTATSGWRREARLLPNAVQDDTVQSLAFALSADGNLLAVGLPNEDALGPNTPENTGAVYLFRRSASTWRLSQKFAGELRTDERFGFVTDLDDAGRTLVVAHWFSASQSGTGTIEVYRDPDDASDQFVHSATLAAPVVNGVNTLCTAASVSGDGATLLRTCNASGRVFVDVMTGIGFGTTARIFGGLFSDVDTTHDGRRILLRLPGGAQVYDLQSTGWVLSGALDGTGPISLSRDGKIAVIGSASNAFAGVGPIFPPYSNADFGSGAVAVYEGKTTGWTLRRMIKPGSTHFQFFGLAVALGDNGRILAVGAPRDPSAATGIGGDWNDASAPERGAAWIY